MYFFIDCADPGLSTNTEAEESMDALWGATNRWSKPLSPDLHVHGAGANQQQGITVPHVNMQRLAGQVLKEESDFPWFHVGRVQVVAYLHRGQ